MVERTSASSLAVNCPFSYQYRSPSRAAELVRDDALKQWASQSTTGVVLANAAYPDVNLIDRAIGISQRGLNGNVGGNVGEGLRRPAVQSPI